jgi:hypothetical protein
MPIPSRKTHRIRYEQPTKEDPLGRTLKMCLDMEKEVT